jgi:hypothetical protein
VVDDRASSHASDAMDAIATRRAGLFFAGIVIASLSALVATAVVACLLGIGDCTTCVCRAAPYGMAAAIAGTALLAGPNVIGHRSATIACALAFAIGCALSLWRAGVQESWWPVADICGELAPPLPAARPGVLLFDRPIAALCDPDDPAQSDSVVATVDFAYSAAMTFVCAVMAAMNDFGRAGQSDA